MGFDIAELVSTVKMIMMSVVGNEDNGNGEKKDAGDDDEGLCAGSLAGLLIQAAFVNNWCTTYKSS